MEAMRTFEQRQEDVRVGVLKARNQFIATLTVWSLLTLPTILIWGVWAPFVSAVGMLALFGMHINRTTRIALKLGLPANYRQA